MASVASYSSRLPAYPIASHTHPLSPRPFFPSPKRELWIPPLPRPPLPTAQTPNVVILPVPPIIIKTCPPEQQTHFHAQHFHKMAEGARPWIPSLIGDYYNTKIQTLALGSSMRLVPMRSSLLSISTFQPPSFQPTHSLFEFPPFRLIVSNPPPPPSLPLFSKKSNRACFLSLLFPCRSTISKSTVLEEETNLWVWGSMVRL